MKNVTKEQFEQFLQNTTTHSEPSRHTDIDYLTETWTDWDDNEVAIETFHKGQAINWMIAE